MKKSTYKRLSALLLAMILALSLAACSEPESSGGSPDAGTAPQTASQNGSGSGTANGIETEAGGGNADANTGSALDISDLFSKRDLEQTADLSEAVTYTVSDGADLSITAAGVYVLSGSAKNVTVYVDAGDEDKVQLVLDGLTVENDDFPVVYVKNADKVFVTTAEGSENVLSVTGTFTADGSTNTDAVIFSRDDLVLNGLGSLTVNSTDNGVSCKDDLKITGGTLTVTAADCAIEANDSIALLDGTVTVSAGKDGLHAENEDDNREGWVWIGGGSLSIAAGDDGIHAVTIVQIDDGSLSIRAAEGIEGTWVQLNGGTVAVTASDDGINGAKKSSAYTACVEINGGSLTVDMGQGDTDGVDSNGDLIITGGTVSINAQSAFDWDGTLTWTGGTVYINGTQAAEITNQFGAGGGTGGPGGQGGFPGGGRGRP